MPLWFSEHQLSAPVGAHVLAHPVTPEALVRADTLHNIQEKLGGTGIFRINLETHSPNLLFW